MATCDDYVRKGKKGVAESTGDNVRFYESVLNYFKVIENKLSHIEQLLNDK